MSFVQYTPGQFNWRTVHPDDGNRNPVADSFAPEHEVAQMAITIDPAYMLKGDRRTLDLAGPEKTEIHLTVTLTELVSRKRIPRTFWQWLTRRPPVIEHGGNCVRLIISLKSDKLGEGVMSPCEGEDSFRGKTTTPYNRVYVLPIPPDFRPGPYRLEIYRVE